MKNVMSKTIRVGGNGFDWSSPIAMTILNVTPDSFWESSRRRTGRDVVKAAQAAEAAGAVIIDVGGCSSRPGADEVSVEDELNRVDLAVKIIRERHPNMIISLDTYRAEVADRIITKYGPCIVNDISSGQMDPEMIATVARLKVPYVAMHMRGTPETMAGLTQYGDIMGELDSFFEKKLIELRKAGIVDIIIDPGFGFAKTTEQSYYVLSQMAKLERFGCPILSGVSRKSMIYSVLNTTPARAGAATIALNWESMKHGASILRVHDTQETTDIIKVFNYYEENRTKIF